MASLGMWTAAGSRLRRARAYVSAHTVAYLLVLTVWATLVAVLVHLTTGRAWSHVAETAIIVWVAMVGVYGFRRFGAIVDRRQ